MKETTARVLLAAVCALLAIQLFRSAPPPARADDEEKIAEVLRARLLELVDEHGRVRARLKVEPGGEVVFRLFDAKETIRVKLGAAEDGSGLVLLDERTEPALQLLANDTQTTVTLAEPGKEKRVIRP